MRLDLFTDEKRVHTTKQRERKKQKKKKKRVKNKCPNQEKQPMKYIERNSSSFLPYIELRGEPEKIWEGVIHRQVQ